MAEDIEDAVHVLDEVELDDGRPDQTFLFPGPRGVFQLEICEADDTHTRRITVPDRNKYRGQYGVKGEGLKWAIVSITTQKIIRDHTRRW